MIPTCRIPTTVDIGHFPPATVTENINACRRDGRLWARRGVPLCDAAGAWEESLGLLRNEVMAGVVA